MNIDKLLKLLDAGFTKDEILTLFSGDREEASKEKHEEPPKEKQEEAPKEKQEEKHEEPPKEKQEEQTNNQVIEELRKLFISQNAFSNPDPMASVDKVIAKIINPYEEENING